MKIAITIRSEDFAQIRYLLDEIRSTKAEVTVLEAPNGITYQFAFPIVTISSDAGLDRHFGSEAMEILRGLTKAAHPG